MNETKNILLKLFILLTCGVGWSSGAWADRIEPTIVSALTPANENVRTIWCYVHFVNSNGGYVYCAADGNNLAFSGSKRVNNDNLWALIGTQSSFVLRNRNGLYAKWDGEKYVGTVNVAEATSCTYTPNTKDDNTTYWNLHRLAASATTNWNPQSGQIKEWAGNADGGSRMEFAVVSDDDWNAITNPNYHVIQYSPAPTASGWAGGTHWYRITNDRSQKILAACEGYMDNNGYLKTRGSGTVAENSDLWCFVQNANGKLSIYNKAAGTNQVLGSMTNQGSNNVRTKLFNKNEDVANFSKLYSVGTNGSGYYVLIDGLTNGYWDDNTSSGYLATWQDAQAPASQGGRFIVSEVIPKGYILTINGDDNYTVSYDGTEYYNGDILPMSIDAQDLNDLTGFRINCTNKFVYGPVINKGLQTITYTIKDMVTSVNDFTTGFYQLQLFDDNNQKVNNVNTRINGSAGNINTKSNTIYVMPYKDVPTGGDQNLAKYSGVPTYGNEASTFFYIEKNANNLQIQSVNGHYAVNDSRERPNATRDASPVTAGYAFPDGHLQLTGWVIQGLWSSSDATGIEGPRVAYNGNNNYEKYNAAKVEHSQYSIYKVVIENATNASDIANDPNVVIVGSSAAAANNRGLEKVYRNGYLFFEKGYVPTAADFTLSGTSYDSNFNITIGEEVDGIRTITFNEIIIVLPEIIHRRAYFYDKYKTVADNLKPRNNSYVGKDYPDPNADDFGFVMNGTTKIQKTSEYRIPVYLEPGTSRQMYMPTDKLAYYQRWYDYKTEGLVNTGVMPVLYSSNFKTYSNGHVSGKVASGIAGWQQNPTFYLPKNAGLATDANGIYEDYIVAVDVSRYKDNSTDNVTGNLTEPTLSQRVIFEIKDANKIAQELASCTGGKWLEERSIIFPTIKRGTTTRNTAKDALPIDMDLNNYWVYNSSHKLVQLTNANQIVVEVDDNTAGITASLMPSIGNNVGWGGVNFSQSHFISFEYPGSGTVRTVPDNSHATVKVYFVEGGNRYQLAKFELSFVPGTDPKIITEVIGKNNNGEYKSERSPYSLEEKYGKPVAELTFDNKNILMKDNLPAGGVDGAGGTDIGTYLFPLDFAMTNYAYGYEKGDGTARGEYTIANARHIPGGQNANFRFKPVQYYYDVLNGTTNEHNNDQFYIYVDASDQPGEVMSLSIRDNLCAGTRLYVSGWMSTTSNNSNPASVILNLVAKKSGTGESKILTSYCPGMLHTFMYDENGNEVAKMNNTTGEATSGIEVNTQYWGLWSQISFSFLLTSADVNDYDEFQLQVLNNCYNSSGGDYLLDNFQIFANPPKGEVDFTTPLCSDKVRHAKIHTDFDMLKDLNGEINGENPMLSATFCFLDAEIFDNFKEGELKISDMFEMDDKGNHNLKSGYSESDDDVLSIINHAFRQALVGSRYIKSSGKEDYGFHSFDIPYNFDDIPTYTYKDSKEDEVYGEVDGQGVRRLVFKENVVRGEMRMEPAEDEFHPAYWPYMRPSRTYYLVFSPVAITEQSQIDAENTATQVFGIQDNCSFFGKFTTKDPLHVILDNADIESDLPVKAVCHGETVDFSFDMPAMKLEKNYPIIDEEYCTSDESLDGHIVPSTNGAKHYRYESVFTTSAVYDVIKDMPYDWWLGGELEGQEFGGKIEDYLGATHPSIRYNEPKDKTNKKHDDPVSIAQAMTDFRFFYPDVDESTLSTVTVKDYNPETGYGLLQSEINTIKSFVEAGIIVLKKTNYTMSLTAAKSQSLTDDELSKMTSNELNSQILNLALTLDDDPAIAALKPLKDLEAAALQEISADGRKELTFQEFAYEPYDQVKVIAGKLIERGDLSITPEQINTMPENELRKTVENALRDMDPAELEVFAKANFTDIGPERRAHLVIRALNIMAEEAAKDPSVTDIREHLRNKMITIFSAQKVDVLRKMWKDTAVKLTEEERAELLGDKNPETMTDQTELGTLIEEALAVITKGIITDLNSDKYVHFTLVPIMPSQETFVDEPYIFCPEPRGVKIRITSHEPRMIDGFADMPYPEDMDNVPVRLGLTQIKETKESTGKNLRIPVRGLKKAAKDGEKAIKLSERTGYYTDIFLTETDDPQYQQTAKAGMAEAKNVEGIYTRMVGKVNAMVAVYPTAVNQNPDNYLEVSFENDMMFREGYTYRVGVNYMEVKEVEVEGVKVTKPTISCPGEMLLDLKIVPEYQKWTASVNNDWTNDRNWARASRAELNAGNAAAGDKIDDKATALDDASSYIDNDGDGGNGTANAFVPMYFTNVLIDKDASAPVLYIEKETEESDVYTPASRSGKTFLKGLHSTATPNAVYDMEVTPADGKGTWPVSEGDYECTLFGTYIANGVTFEPGAQLGNAHYLTYNKAWVEYELDAGRWYTLGSGLKASVAGDWYSPTAGGKQKTPHFYDINYDPANNDRFRPAYYQRSWDRGGNNIVYEKSGGTYDSFVKADWSYVYNDAAVNYSVGGFSVKPELGYMDPEDRPADGKVLVRLPKADASYTYYDKAGDIGQADPAQIGNRAELKSYRLMSDDLNADGSGTINMSVANESADNNFLLLSNPFMAAMDMDEFFAVNDGLEAQYWVVDADRQDVSVKSTDGTWITTGDGNGKYVAPLQGFFVKTKNSTNSVEASYTADMQTVADLDASQRPVVLQAPATRAASATEAGIIRLTAVRNDHTSTAIIMLNDNASDGNVSGEDCETFIDGNLYELPTVYTSAGNVAQTINVRQSLKMVPVGMISADDSETMLRFDISDDIADSLYLYDAELDSITEIADGTEVMMSGNNAGRYFITDSVEDNMMTATATVQQGVYTPSGIYVGKTTKGLQPGLYIVDGVKMMVK